MQLSLSALRNAILQARFDTYFITVEHADMDVKVEPTALFDTVTTMMDHHGADHRIDAEPQSFGPDDTLTVTSFNAA